MEKSNNKRIAKNATMLYIRMVILLFVNLYASRIVLKELGVEDFGIYNIVGGIVAMFTFLNTTMSGATSRFLTYELGAGDLRRLKETFKVAITLHIGVALAILMIAETIGLWFVNYELVIPQDRMWAANIVYQFSILTIMLKTMQVPFNASIIANERMHVYAYTELVNGLLMISLVSLMQFCQGDKLIIYAAILSALALGVFSMYAFYCLRNFKESSFAMSFNRTIMLPMLKFSGFDLYGNMCVTAKTQGVNILLNLFFGPLLNAANGISVQVQAGLTTLSNTVIEAFRPQIIKHYASKELPLMINQVYNASILSFLLFSILAVPIFIEMPFVLEFWLGNPPNNTVSITRIAIFTCWVGTLNSCLNIPIHATGKIKLLSIVAGSSYLLTVPVTYWALKLWTSPESAYYTMFFFVFALMIITCCILKKLMEGFSMRVFFNKIIKPCVISVMLSIIPCLIIFSTMEESFLRFLLVFIVYFVALVCSASLIVLSCYQRKILLDLIKSKIR